MISYFIYHLYRELYLIQIQIMGVINKIHEHAAIIYPQIYKYETRVAEGRAVSPL